MHIKKIITKEKKSGHIFRSWSGPKKFSAPRCVQEKSKRTGGERKVVSAETLT